MSVIKEIIMMQIGKTIKELKNVKPISIFDDEIEEVS